MEKEKPKVDFVKKVGRRAARACSGHFEGNFLVKLFVATPQSDANAPIQVLLGTSLRKGVKNGSNVTKKGF